MAGAAELFEPDFAENTDGDISCVGLEDAGDDSLSFTDEFAKKLRKLLYDAMPYRAEEEIHGI